MPPPDERLRVHTPAVRPPGIAPVLLPAVLLAGAATRDGDLRSTWNDWRHTDELSGTVVGLDVPGGPRSQAAVVGLGDDRVLVWGGRGTSADSGLVLDAGERTWEPVPPATGPSRFGAATAWTGTEAVVWGGSTSTSPFVLDAGGEAYDPVARTWRSLPPAPVALFGARAAALDGGLLITGGEQLVHPSRPVTLWLDDDTGGWSQVPTSFTALHTVRRGEELLATGPVDLHTGAVWAVQRFDPDTLTWSPVADPVETHWMALAVAEDGTLSAVTKDRLDAPLRAYAWTGQAWEERAESRRAAAAVVTIELVGYPPVTEAGAGVLHLGGAQELVTWDPDTARFSHGVDRAFRSFGGTAVWTGDALVVPVSQDGRGWRWTP